MKAEITNLRGLGGIKVKNGQVKDGLLYRGGQLENLTDQQVDLLKDTLHIRRIVDFRSEREKQSMPDTLWPEADYEWINILADAQRTGASVAGMLSNSESNDQVTSAMLNTYEILAVSQSALSGYHDFMELLVNNAEPTFFHCFACKDRTGVGAAIILKTLGASKEEIFADYMITNKLRKKANEQLIKKFGQYMDERQKVSFGRALIVDHRYLDHYFATIEHNFGSFDSYLLDGLKLEPDFVTEFRNLYVQ